MRNWSGPLAVVAMLLFPALALAQDSPTVWTGAYSAAQATRGQALYTAHCASCHGDGLTGADIVPALTGATFLANWQGQTVADLARRIRTTMPLDNPGSLGLAATADITAYIFSRNGFPAGTNDLPPSAGAQGGIKITPRAGG